MDSLLLNSFYAMSRGAREVEDKTLQNSVAQLKTLICEYTRPGSLSGQVFYPGCVTGLIHAFLDFNIGKGAFF